MSNPLSIRSGCARVSLSLGGRLGALGHVSLCDRAASRYPSRRPTGAAGRRGGRAAHSARTHHGPGGQARGVGCGVRSRPWAPGSLVRRLRTWARLMRGGATLRSGAVLRSAGALGPRTNGDRGPPLARFCHLFYGFQGYDTRVSPPWVILAPARRVPSGVNRCLLCHAQRMVFYR